MIYRLFILNRTSLLAVGQMLCSAGTEMGTRAAVVGPMTHRDAALDPLVPHPHLLVRWFVQYNPMFTASALCVLGGVLLLQRTVASDGVVLTGVVELYQWLVIGTAALLSRRLHDHRPGVILGLVALIFLIDPTLQTSALATAGLAHLSLAWVGLFALKLHALAWAFRLRLSSSARLLPIAGAALIVALPMLRMGDHAPMVPGVLAVALFLMGALSSFVSPTMVCTRALGEVGAVMFPRLQRATAGIFVVGALYQGGNAVFAEGAPAFFAAVMAVLAGVVMHARREQHLWFAALGTVWAGVIAGLTTTIALPMLAVALFIAAARHAHAPRVFVAGLVAAALPGLGATGVLAGDPGSIAVAVVATIGMVWLLSMRRAWSAPLGLAVVHARTVQVLLLPAVASTSGGTWGVALVVAGFGLIPAGVLIHRRLSAVLAAAERDAEAATALRALDAEAGLSSSSAAVPAL